MVTMTKAKHKSLLVGWRKGTVALTRSGKWGQELTYESQGWYHPKCPGLCVADSEPGEWTVTHVASGKAIARFRKRSRAQKAAHDIAALGFDWTQSEDDLMRKGDSKFWRESNGAIRAIEERYRS